MSKPDAAAGETAAKPEVTAEIVARFFAREGVKVRVAKRDKAGKPIYLLDANGKSTGVFDVEVRPIAAADILSFRAEGERYFATTVDGQKLPRVEG